MQFYDSTNYDKSCRILLTIPFPFFFAIRYWSFVVTGTYPFNIDARAPDHQERLSYAQS